MTTPAILELERQLALTDNPEYRKTLNKRLSSYRSKHRQSTERHLARLEANTLPLQKEEFVVACRELRIALDKVEALLAPSGHTNSA